MPGAIVRPRLAPADSCVIRLGYRHGRAVPGALSQVPAATIRRGRRTGSRGHDPRQGGRRGQGRPRVPVHRTTRNGQDHVCTAACEVAELSQPCRRRRTMQHLSFVRRDHRGHVVRCHRARRRIPQQGRGRARDQGERLDGCRRGRCQARVHPRRGSHAFAGSGQRPAQDPRGTTGTCRVRPRNDGAVQGARHDQVPITAVRLPPRGDRDPDRLPRGDRRSRGIHLRSRSPECHHVARRWLGSGCDEPARAGRCARRGLCDLRGDRAGARPRRSHQLPAARRGDHRKRCGGWPHAGRIARTARHRPSPIRRRCDRLLPWRVPHPIRSERRRDRGRVEGDDGRVELRREDDLESRGAPFDRRAVGRARADARRARGTTRRRAHGASSHEARGVP